VNRRLIPLVLTLLATLGTACEPALPRPIVPPTASPAPVPTIVIGAILNVGVDAGLDGQQRYEAATLAVDLINRRGGVRLPSGERRPLQLVVYDDDGEPSRSEPALRRLVSDGALAVIGPSSPESTGVVRPAAETAGVPLISLAENRGDAGETWRWTFAMAAPPEEALAAMIDFFASSGVDRFAWLAPRTTEAANLRRALVRQAIVAGMQVVGEEGYLPGADTHADSLARLQLAEPRVILAWPRDSQEAASIAREAARVPNLVPLFLGPAASATTTLTQSGDGAAVVRTVSLRLQVSDDLWDHDALTPVIRDFRRELQTRTGRPPTVEATGAWDAVRLIVTAIERPAPPQSGVTRATVRDGLESITDYLGASGTISFSSRRHDGLDRRALVVARSEGRRWRLPP
jgi:branched-chain amino acid transport system substrate-binding protein